ncbi:MAG: hypothetical protein KDD53_11425 [Bdellovibrionales bacterium]|nr:hypothetical protein [Bdellovibrionales bacterium]
MSKLFRRLSGKAAGKAAGRTDGAWRWARGLGKRGENLAASSDDVARAAAARDAAGLKSNGFPNRDSAAYVGVTKTER